LPELERHDWHKKQHSFDKHARFTIGAIVPIYMHMQIVYVYAALTDCKFLCIQIVNIETLISYIQACTSDQRCPRYEI